VKIVVPKGKYVVAVSGGVDSIVLLDLLSKMSGLNIIVAHFNHGIRPDSELDEKLVMKTADSYQLPFVVGNGRLGHATSEDKAREVRYKFLNDAKRLNGADSIITAHHQDDLLETAILNLLRGTGRRGLSAISDNPDIIRPLLNVPKPVILSYAKEHRLKWREDISNQDDRYLRNFIRHRITPRFTSKQRQDFLGELDKMSGVNQILDHEIANLSQNIIHGNTIDRSAFIALPNEIGKEVLVNFLRKEGIRQFDRPAIERLATAIRTARQGSKVDVTKGAYLEMTASEAHLMISVNS
jgi:tRNA(Ile)-lysidine synthase